jgi:hypothetical protein
MCNQSFVQNPLHCLITSFIMQVEAEIGRKKRGRRVNQASPAATGCRLHREQGETLMKMMTKEIASKLVAADKAFLADPEGRTGDEVIVKFFSPWGNANWHIVTATPLDKNGEPDYENAGNAADWHMFGFCDLGIGPGCAELGYVLLSELEGIKGPFGLKIEREYHSGGHSLKAVIEKESMKWAA